MNPSFLAVTVTILIGLLVLAVPRRYAVLPFLFGAIFIPIGQVIVGGFNFYPFRILILFGWLRLLSRGEFSLTRFETIDKFVVAWALASTLAYTLLWQSFSALQNGLGLAFNAIGAYFFFRCYIRDIQSARRVVRVLALISVLVAVAVLIERMTGQNLFFALGAFNQMSEVREGSLRCQGPFGHSILAGSFAATLIPLLVALRGEPRAKKWAMFGFVSCAIIVASSNSSGPVITLLAGMIGLAFWPLRENMRRVRWALVVAIVGLHIVMKAPVWALIARFSVLGSSSGDHRYRLVDSFIQNVGEWWLVGTRDYVDWGWVLWDVSNHYVRVGVDGGIFTLILFVCIIVGCFKGLGSLLRRVPDLQDKKFVWYMGAALFAHLVAFVGVSYWDQMIVVWHLLLAMIASMVATFRPVAARVQPTVVLQPVEAR